MLLKKGIKLLEEFVGKGESVYRKHNYIVAIRITLNHGEIVSCPNKCLSHSIDENLKVTDDGYFLHRIRVDRENLIPGIFYAIDGMKIGGYRKVSISPHLAYKKKGIPGVIPENAKLIVEIKVIRQVE